MEKRLLDDTNYSTFVKYSKNRRDRNLRIVGRNKWEKFINTFCEVVAEGLTESEGGVVLNEIGYFFVWEVPAKIPIRRYVGNTKEDYYNLHTEGKFFTPVFLPSKKHTSTFNMWSMDNTFSVPVKRKIFSNLTKQNKRYKNYMYTLHNLLK